jgi:predicted ATPase
MQIISFQAQALHGYMDRSIRFNRDVTYITGINGTGKTSVVRSVISLLQPSLAYLIETDFRFMSLVFTNDSDTHNICAYKSQDNLTIFSHDSPHTLELPGMQPDGDTPGDMDLVLRSVPSEKQYTVKLISEDPYESPTRFRERWLDFIAEQETLSANHPLISFLRSIPTPLFLGLERRSGPDTPEEARRQGVPARRLRGPFSGTVQESVLEAKRLVEEKYRETMAEHTILADQLRKNILLAVFRRNPVDVGMKVKWPDRRYMDTLRRKHETVQIALEAIGIEREQIDKRVAPFFNELERLSSQLSRSESFAKALNDDSTQAMAIAWMQLMPQEDQADLVYRFVQSFNKETDRIFTDIRKYQSLVNQFLADGSKTLDFTSQGSVVIRLPNGKVKPMTAMSSGESHIVVILTQLFFNPKRNEANVLIIDEPELSLHIKWQESFVQAVQSASERLQVILATHSPSIFLDQIDKCVDLS